MRSILDLSGRDANRSIRATRTSQLYSSGDPLKGRNVGTGVYLLDRIEAALEQAGGDPAKASAICGIAEREIAKIQDLKARAAVKAESPARTSAAETRRQSRKDPVTANHIADLVAAAATHGSYVRAGRALGWSELRTWAVHRQALAKGAIERKAVRA